MSKAVLNPFQARLGRLEGNRCTVKYIQIYNTGFRNSVVLNITQQDRLEHTKSSVPLCQSSLSDEGPVQDEGIQFDIAVGGMMCDGCTSRIEEELAKKESVVAVKADLDSGNVAITVSVDNFGDAAQLMESLVHDINNMGFEAQPQL